MENKEIYAATEILGSALKEHRRKNKKSLRDVRDETGINPSTLSRIENRIGKPDADNVAILAEYLNIPVDRVLHDTEDAPVVYYPDESLPEIVEAHLRRDKNLTREDAARLSEIFRTAYGEFAGFGKKD